MVAPLIALAIPKLLEGLATVIDRVIPDKVAAQAAKDALAAASDDREFQLAMAQIAVNAEDAKSEKWWKAGWRPAIGWVCVAVLGLSYIPKAIALTVFWCYQSYLLFAHPEVSLPALPPFPDLGITDVLGILGTLLGAGWMAKLRTDEKKEGLQK